LSFIHFLCPFPHSHLWIAFAGWPAVSFSARRITRCIIPPTRSLNPNLGSCLAVWDWMFVTFMFPQDGRAIGTFGVEGHVRDGADHPRGLRREASPAAQHVGPVARAWHLIRIRPGTAGDGGARLDRPRSRFTPELAQSGGVRSLLVMPKYDMKADAQEAPADIPYDKHLDLVPVRVDEPMPGVRAFCANNRAVHLQAR